MSGTRWTGLSAREVRVLVCEVTYSRRAPERASLSSPRAGQLQPSLWPGLGQVSVPLSCNGQDRAGYVSFLLVMHANQVVKRTI